MHQLENRLIAGQLPGGVGKIVVGDQFAADHLGQGVGIQHGLHDMVAELGRAELALSVGLHGQRGVEKPLVVAGAGLVQYNKNCRRAPPARTDSRENRFPADN